jgi:cytochrome c oxidase assembly factor CtaG
MLLLLYYYIIVIIMNLYVFCGLSFAILVRLKRTGTAKLPCNRLLIYTHVAYVWFVGTGSGQRNADDHSDGEHRFETIVMRHLDLSIDRVRTCN